MNFLIEWWLKKGVSKTRRFLRHWFGEVPPLLDLDQNDSILILFKKCLFQRDSETSVLRTIVLGNFIRESKMIQKTIPEGSKYLEIDFF